MKSLIRLLLNAAIIEVADRAKRTKENIVELIYGPGITPHKRADVFLDAIKHGDEDAVRRLVKENPGIIEAPLHGTYGYNALMCVAELLNPKHMERGPLWVPAPEKLNTANIERIGFLLINELKADVNATETWQGHTPLILAARSGATALAARMIEAGARVNKVDNYGYSPLMWAASGGHVEMVEHLLNKGADVNIVGSESSALLLAIQGRESSKENRLMAEKYYRIFTMLLDKGAYVDDNTLKYTATINHALFDSLSGMRKNQDAVAATQPLHRRLYNTMLIRLRRKLEMS